MTHAILFDLDGTLVDHESAARAALHAWSPTVGVDTDVERWIELDRWGFARFERGETTHLGQRRDRIRAYLNKQLDDDTCDEIYAGYLTAYANNWTAYPDALGALERALSTGNPVGILTNGAAPMQQDKLDRTGLGLNGLIMLAASTLDSAKPRPEMYARALEKVGAQTATIIGDDWVNDVEKPRELGWTAIYLDRSATDPRADINSLSELNF